MKALVFSSAFFYDSLQTHYHFHVSDFCYLHYISVIDNLAGYLNPQVKYKTERKWTGAASPNLSTNLL
ncbi:MAG TPA: hypothetical protein DCQ26_11940 [Marinilabiliales bacterium]|nr:MAG: hypothetical protein A2W95_02235 [Bacteroidetes bacterium GWA2_40_14]OFX57062.1 MAG: hypothetical protein A2W84_12050 [Bacteroidetes bacterium GWC2_40_13]OFX72188.1 MAG: hypothetical protein A2W96_05770 [Bacteroidetes bacterium GWD2_40_43]OFX94254.1 MAG: hypothetical protein A2W97_18970 [Bacteroidetes bacterium GWE2_40_63]OFY23677.1 MAG: hypothetical protein A2W88_12870 [Bacteroidetes bacterium GWF2_40_13]OFZ25248.1 MAG: hypothetical protein A2437_07655 [Bacteroidetes bacterium RIFOXYC